MMQITQSIDYEGTNHQVLNQRLKDFYQEHPFKSGFDWEFQYLWATMTDEDCLAFCLKYPEYSQRFKEVANDTI